MNPLLEYFPLPKIRSEQLTVLNTINKALQKGYKNIILEAPVGSGKSAIAVTLARYLGDAHVITPRKALQDQYYEDFHKTGLTLMKGRSSYHCNLDPFSSCKDGPCATDRSIKSEVCNNKCPYTDAMEIAQKGNLVVHNIHSFIYQGYFAERFQPRKLMIIDEAHMIEGAIREFGSKSLVIPKLYISPEKLPTKEDLPLLSDWANWLKTFEDKFSGRKNSKGESPQSRYQEALTQLDYAGSKTGDSFVVDLSSDRYSETTKISLIPNFIGPLANELLFNFGEVRLFMSGTIFDHSLFCRILALDPKETAGITIPSTFPVQNRPIISNKSRMIDLSFNHWNGNYKKLLVILLEIAEEFKEVKGLIHTPSYDANTSLFNSLKKNPRFVTHDRETFQSSLQAFYDSEKPLIFLSPICTQGVDFKDDRARFQVILRVPYLSPTDPFVKEKMGARDGWYNLQALVTFGQQIGRIVRSEMDTGTTLLVDERFNRFLSNNEKLLPDWLKKAIIKS